MFISIEVLYVQVQLDWFFFFFPTIHFCLLDLSLNFELDLLQFAHVVRKNI